MRVLVYDHDQERNQRIYELVEDLHVFLISASCLKDFLKNIEHPALKILRVEQSRVQHYNIDVKSLLERLGFTIIVIVYSETTSSFDYSVYYLQSYYHFPFITNQDKKIFKKIKDRLENLKVRKKRENRDHSAGARTLNQTNETSISQIIDQFSGKQRQLLRLLFEKKDGLTTEEIIQLLSAQTVKDSQNYVQTHIYRLRNRLQLLYGQQYIITHKNRRYRILHLSNE